MIQAEQLDARLRQILLASMLIFSSTTASSLHAQTASIIGEAAQMQNQTQSDYSKRSEPLIGFVNGKTHLSSAGAKWSHAAQLSEAPYGITFVGFLKHMDSQSNCDPKTAFALLLDSFHSMGKYSASVVQYHLTPKVPSSWQHRRMIARTPERVPADDRRAAVHARKLAEYHLSGAGTSRS